MQSLTELSYVVCGGFLIFNMFWPDQCLGWGFKSFSFVWPDSFGPSGMIFTNHLNLDLRMFKVIRLIFIEYVHIFPARRAVIPLSPKAYMSSSTREGSSAASWREAVSDVEEAATSEWSTGSCELPLKMYLFFWEYNNLSTIFYLYDPLKSGWSWPRVKIPM